MTEDDACGERDHGIPLCYAEHVPAERRTHTFGRHRKHIDTDEPDYNEERTHAPESFG